MFKSLSGYANFVRLNKLWKEELLGANIYNRIIKLMREYSIDKAEDIFPNSEIKTYTFDTLDYTTLLFGSRIFWLHEEDGLKILSMVK
jgi:hypothetical protein